MKIKIICLLSIVFLFIGLFIKCSVNKQPALSVEKDCINILEKSYPRIFEYIKRSQGVRFPEDDFKNEMSFEEIDINTNKNIFVMLLRKNRDGNRKEVSVGFRHKDNEVTISKDGTIDFLFTPCLGGRIEKGRYCTNLLKEELFLLLEAIERELRHK